MSRDFRLYQVARLLSTIAEQMVAVAVGWQVYERTGRAFDLGLVGLVQFVPTLALSLAAGHATDRFDRRRVIIVCALALALVCALLELTASATGNNPTIYGMLVCFAAGRTFLGPAEQALLPDVVPAAELGRAVAWTSSLWEIGAIAGPALGGWIYSAAHRAGAVYLTASVAYLLIAIATFAMTVRTGRMEERPATLSTVFAGIVYIRRNQVVLGAISLDLFAVLFGGAVALLPIFAHDILHTGPWGLGLLRSAPAIGAALVAVFLALRPLQRRAGAILLGSVALYGVATLAFGASRNVWLSLIALAIVGGADMVSVVVRSTLIQLATPPEMRGRVGAVNQVFIGASSELGALESGMAAAWLGAVPAVLVGGIAALAVVGVYALVFRDLRRVDRLDE